MIETSREGRILTSVPGIGIIQAAIILAMVGNIANFERLAQLKSYFGWAPTLAQSGKTLDHARLSPRGQRLMKQTMYLVAWRAVRVEEREWAHLYHRLVPLKCAYDERKRDYVGRGKVLGRVAGQMTALIFTLLKRDQARIALAHGTMPPEPELYDAETHHRHRAGQYKPAPRARSETVTQLPTS